MRTRWPSQLLALLATLSAVPSSAQESIAYTYDALGRLVSSTVTGGPAGGTQKITTFDTAGNRVTHTVSNAPVSNAVFSINNVSATEGAPLVFTITKSGTATGSLSVNYSTSNGTASDPSDYTGSSGTVTFPSTQMSATITIATASDTLVEGNETVTVTLSGATPGSTISTATGTGTINDDDASFAISNATAATEGGVMTFTVTKTGGVAASVNYASASGTATSGTDFTPASGTLSFLAGETSKPITVQTTEDSATEAAETVLMNLSGATGGATITTAQGTGTINDNDAAPPSFAIGNATTVAEGGTLTFTVTKTGTTTSSFSVNYASAGGTATADTDFTSVSGTLTFLPSETSKTITVATTDDAIYEAHETVLMNLSGVTGGATITTAQGTGTINNNDPIPTFAISNASPVTEGGALTFTVTRSGAAFNTFYIHYATAGGTATSGTDFTAVAAGELIFPPTATSMTITIPTIDDSVAEASETVLLNLTTASGGATFTTAQGTGTIIDND